MTKLKYIFPQLPASGGWRVFLLLTIFSLPFSVSYAQVLSNSGAVFSVSASSAVSNITNVENGSGTISNNGTLSINGNVTNGGTISGSGSYTIKGNFTNNGTFTPSTSTVTMNGTSAQTIGGSNMPSFYNLTIDNGSGVTLLGSSIINGTLTLTSGPLAIGGNTLTLNSTLLVSGGSLSAGSGTVIYNQSSHGQVVGLFNYLNLTFSNYNKVLPSGSIGISGTFTPGSATGHTITGNTINFNGGAQSIPTFTYNHLTLSGGTVVKTASGPLSVAGNITISSGVTFVGGAYTHTIAGNWIKAVDGTFFATGSTIEFNGTGSITASNFNNLTISAGTRTAIGILDIEGNFNLSGETFVAGAYTHTVAGNWTKAGGATFTATGSTIEFDGSGNVSASNFNNLTISAGTRTATGALTIGGHFNLSGTSTFVGRDGSNTYTHTVTGNWTKAGGATFTATGTTIQFIGIGNVSASNFNNLTISAGTRTAIGTLDIDGNFNLSGGTFDANGLTHTVAGNWTKAGTFLSYGTIVFDGADQSIGASNFYDVIFGGTGTKTASGILSIEGNLTINSGSTLNAGSHIHSVLRNWVNNGSFTRETSTVVFGGADEAEISGSAVTYFYHLTLNKTDSSTPLELASDIQVDRINMTSGILLTYLNKITIFETRTGPGIILGTIVRTHSYSLSTVYEFESPNNTITFTSATSLPTSITVKVVAGVVVGDFPDPGSIKREYTHTLTGASGYSAVLRLHYEDIEVNGSDESQLRLFQFNGAWTDRSFSSRDASANYVEQIALTDISGRWTLSSVTGGTVRWVGDISTDWRTAGNWIAISGAPSTPPTKNDIALIGDTTFTNGRQPIVSNIDSIKAIRFGSVTPSTVTISSGALRVLGDVSGIWSADANHTINIGANELRVNGNLTLSEGASNRVINLNATSGTIIVGATLTQTANANVSIGTGSLRIGGHYIKGGPGTFTAGTGTVYYDGVSVQDVAAVNYYDLTISKTASTATLKGNTTVGRHLLISGGTLELGSTSIAFDLTVSGNVTINSGTTLNARNKTISVGGNWSRSGTFAYTPGASNVTLNGSGTQTISATTFNTLEINKSAGTAQSIGNLTLGNLLITQGTLDIQGFTANRSGGTGIIRLDAGTKLLIGSTNSFPSGYFTHVIHATSTVEYGGTNQNVLSLSYGHLTLSNAGTKTATGDLFILGNITIGTSVTFAGGAYTHYVGGNWIRTGTFSSTGTIRFNGTNQNIDASNFNHIIFEGSNIKTALGSLLIGGNVQILSGATFAAGSYTHTINGNWSRVGTFDRGTSTIIFAGSGTSLIDGTDFHALQINKSSAGVQLQSDVVIYNSLSIISGFLELGTYTANASGSPVAFSMSPATVLRIQNIFPASYSSYSLDPLSRVEYVGGVQDVLGGINYGSLLIGGSSTKTLTAGNIVIYGDLEVSTAIFDLGTFSANRNALGGTFTLADGSKLRIGGTTIFPDNFSTYTLGPSSHVEYYGNSGPQNVKGLNYGTLELSGGSKVLDNSATIRIRGAFLPSTPSGHTITGSTIEFSSASAQIIPAFDYFNLSSSSTGSRTVSSGSTIKIAGSFTPGTNAYTLTGSTVEYNGTAAQTVAPLSYHNLTVSNARGGAQITFGSGTISIAGTFSFTATNYTLSSTGNTVAFIGGAQDVPALTYNSLRIAGSANKNALGSFTVNGTFTLDKDLLLTTYELTLGSGATTVGLGDAHGIVKRTTIVNGITYTFGNEHTRIIFNSGTPPTALVVTMTPNGSPTSKPDAVRRYYDINPTGGSGISATVRLHYKQSELYGNTEADLSLWRYASGTWTDRGRTGSVNTTNKYVELTGVTEFSEWGLGNATLDHFIISFTSPQQNGVAFSGVNTITAKDQNGGTITSYNASFNPVVLTSTPPTGTIYGLGSGNNHILDQASDFSAGVANVTGEMFFAGPVGSYTFTATTNGKTGVSGAVQINVGPAAQLAFTTEPGNGTGGSNLSTQPVVTVQDAGGNTVTDATNSILLAIAANPGGGTLSATTNPLSAVNGVAAFSGVKIDKVGTGYTLSASSGPFMAISDPFNITVGSAVQLAFTTQPSNGTGGTVLPTQPIVSVQDAGGNTVPSATNSVTLAIGTNPSGGTLSVTTNPLDAVGGVAAFTGVKIDKAGSGYTLTAAASGLTGATSNSFDILVGPAAKLAFTTQPGNGTGGSDLSPQPVVTIQDAGGNTVSSATNEVTLSVTGNPPGVTLTATPNPLAASAGVATFSGVKIDKAGGYTITASAAGLTSAVSNAITISVGPPVQLVFTTQPVPGTGGLLFTTQPVVSITDAGGNVVTSATNSVTLAIGTNPSGGTLSVDTNPLSAVAGIAAFTGVKIDKAGTGYTLTAAASGLTGATSSAFNVDVGPPAKLALKTPINNTTGGIPFDPQPVVEIQDAGGNKVPTATNPVELSVAFDPPGVSVLATQNPLNAINGTATFDNARVNKAGTGYRIVAKSGALQPDTSNTFSISVGPAAKLIFTTQPGNGTGGTDLTTQPVVAITDAGGNIVTSGTNSVLLAIGTNPSGGTLTVTTNPLSATAGIASFSGVKINKAGNGYTLTASSSGLTSATSDPFNINIGPAAKLAFVVQPTTTDNGAVITPPIEVEAQDLGGNRVTIFTGNITIALGLNPAGGTLYGTKIVAAVEGKAVFNSLSIDRAGSGYTLIASSSPLAGIESISFDIGIATLTFYSRENGAWSSPSVWSIFGHTGPPNGRVPSTGDKAVIGNSNTVTLDISVNNPVSVRVSGTGVLHLGTSVIDGTGTFTLHENGTIGIGSPQGIVASGASGNIQTAVRTFHQNATYIYNGTAAQQSGSALPVAVKTVVVENPVGLSFTNPIAINDTLLVRSNGVLAPDPTRTIDGQGRLTGSGTVKVTGSSFNSQYPIAVYDISDLTVDYSSTGSQVVNAIQYGALVISGARSTNNVTIEGQNILSIAKTFVVTATFTTGKFNTEHSTIQFNGSIAQIIPAFTYHHLVVGGSNTKTASGSLSLAGDMSIVGTFDGGGLTHTVSGNWSKSGTFISSGSTIHFNGTTAQSIGASNFGSILFSGSGAKTATGNLALTDSLKINSGATFNAGTGTHSIGRHWIITGTFNANTSTIHFNGTSPQSIAASTFNHLTFSGGGQKNAAGAFTVKGNMTINTGATVALGSHALTLEGNVSNSGTISFSNPQTTIFDGNSTLSGSGVFAFNHVTINSSKLLNAGSSSMTVSGNWLNHGIFNANGLLSFTSSSNATFTGAGIHNFGGLQVNKGGGSLTISVNLSANAVTLLAGNMILSSTTTLTLPMSGTPLSVSGGTFTPQVGSTVRHTGAGTVTIAGLTYHHLTIENGGGTYWLGGNATIQGTLTLSAGGVNTGTQKFILGATASLVEPNGNPIQGTIEATRKLTTAREAFGGIGVEIEANVSPDTTIVTRKTGSVITGLSGNSSIKRSFTIHPKVNTGLNATLTFKYDDSELNGANESQLKLWRSVDNGSTWQFRGGVINTADNTITVAGLTGFSLWTAAEGSFVASTLSVLNFKDGDGNIMTQFDRAPKAWHLMIRSGSSSGPIVAQVTSAISLLVDTLQPGTYHVSRADSSSMGWGFLGYQIDNATPVVSSVSGIDVVVGMGQTIVVNFLNSQPGISTMFFVNGDQKAPVLVSDGNGGAIVGWLGDYYNGYKYRGKERVFRQKISRFGSIMWPDPAVHTSNYGSTLPATYLTGTTDGSGGAIFSWSAKVGSYYNLTSDRTSSGFTSGNWSFYMNHPNSQKNAKSVSDGKGGAIIVFESNHVPGKGYDIFVNRVASTGVLMWGTPGKLVSSVSRDQTNPQIVSDGSGGAIIVWQSNQTSSAGWDLYAQRVDSTGNLQWQANGVSIAALRQHQMNPRAISDGKGGAYIVWESYQSRSWDIYGQRINAIGQVKWTANGVPVTSEPRHQKNPDLCSDGQGGVIVVFESSVTSPVRTNIYAQRMDSLGVRLWTEFGFAVTIFDLSQKNPKVVPDGQKGALVIYETYQNRLESNWDIYGQRINENGDVLWDYFGQPISNAPGIQKNIAAIADGNGGAIVAWETYQLGNWDIGIRSITGGGAATGSDYLVGGDLTPPDDDDEKENPTTFDPEIPDNYVLEQNFPNPFNPSTTIEFHIPEASLVTLQIFNVLGQEVKTLAYDQEFAEGKHRLMFETFPGLPSGVYFARIVAKAVGAELDAEPYIKIKRMMFLK